ncbi:Hemophore HasA-Heme acquisition system protein A [Moritella viscosa]|uniref:heme acquisition protein HasA n=1 Tax=Moritella viscosa TaxID=80854 RepID=UPI00091ED738|nr:heme acquisition protein HasA [Moritella viscosa]SGY93556.1 Hemophore HasA-Heme acquisition system protein A [Moritella viscosa]
MSLNLTFTQAFVNTDFNNDGINNNTLNDYFGSLSGTMSFSKLALFGSFNGGMFSGSQFGLETNKSGSDNAFVASAEDGDSLTYSFFSNPSHTLYGELDSLDLGVGLNKSGSEWSTDSSMLGINGLSEFINDGRDASGNIIARTTGNNDVHNIVWGLMHGDTSALATVMSDAGVDLNGAITTAGTVSYAAAADTADIMELAA